MPNSIWPVNFVAICYLRGLIPSRRQQRRIHEQVTAMAMLILTLLSMSAR
jgi:hypothetical protein